MAHLIDRTLALDPSLSPYLPSYVLCTAALSTSSNMTVMNTVECAGFESDTEVGEPERSCHRPGTFTCSKVRPRINFEPTNEAICSQHELTHKTDHIVQARQGIKIASIVNSDHDLTGITISIALRHIKLRTGKSTNSSVKTECCPRVGSRRISSRIECLRLLRRVRRQWA